MEYLQRIDGYKEELIASLQGCIRIPSVRGETEEGAPYGANLKRCLNYVLELAERMGFSVHNMDGQLGWCEWGDGEEMVAVLSHLDVVPEGEGWTVPPYEGRILNGRIYGRGTMDDKGPAMASLYALYALKESRVTLKRRIRLLFGLNEETGSADMKYYLAHGGELPVMGITPDGEYPVINGEKGLVTQAFARNLEQTGKIRMLEIQGGTAHNIVPDEASVRLACSRERTEQIMAMQAENILCTPTPEGVRICAVGTSAHGGTPWEGENAIGRLLLFLDRLPLEGDLRQTFHMLAQRFGMEWNGQSLGIALRDAESGELTMNLGVIRGDEHQLEVKMSYRYPVTCTFEQCGPAVEEVFREAGFRQTCLLHKEAIYMNPDSLLVQTLLRVYGEYTGQPTIPKCIGGGTYAKMMPNTLAFGPVFPGDEVREHKPDEFMELIRLLDNAKLLARAMEELANSEDI
ncbi:MAG: dipeptidase PepV [Lachnospiraceae bacterium]|nr:dipeptidase PepV [Lachnospiraceae bacterium]